MNLKIKIIGFFAKFKICCTFTAEMAINSEITLLNYDNMKLKKKVKQEFYGRVSKYLEDVSKLVIAGVVLSSITKGDIGMWGPVILGILVGAVILYGSFYAFVKSKNIK